MQVLRSCQMAVTHPESEEVDFNSSLQHRLAVHKGAAVPFGFCVYAILV